MSRKGWPHGSLWVPGTLLMSQPSTAAPGRPEKVIGRLSISFSLTQMKECLLGCCQVFNEIDWSWAAVKCSMRLIGAEPLLKSYKIGKVSKKTACALQARPTSSKKNSIDITVAPCPNSLDCACWQQPSRNVLCFLAEWRPLLHGSD